MGPSGVGEVAGSGELISTDRRLFGASGPVGMPIDPAIGRILTIDRQSTHTSVLGERGATLIASGEPFLGGGTYLFDPVTVGIGVAAGAWGFYSRRPDGVMVVQSFIDLETACD